MVRLPVVPSIVARPLDVCRYLCVNVMVGNVLLLSGLNAYLSVRA